MSILGLQIHNTYTTHVKKCVLLCVVLGSSLVCMACLKPGTFTRRLDANDTRLEVIGDTDMYSAFKKWCLVGRNLVLLGHFHNNFRLKRKLPEIEMFAFGFSARPSSCLYRQTSTKFGRKLFWKCPKITKLRQSDAKI